MTTKFFNTKELEQYSDKIISLIVKNHNNYRNMDVFPKDFSPGMLQKYISTIPPTNESSIDDVIKTTEDVILPNILKWQHPRFHGYFQSISSTPAIFAETIITALNPVTFQWSSSPASTELDCIINNWVVKMLNLPDKFLLTNQGGGAIVNSIGEALFLAVQFAKYKKQKELNIKNNNPKIFNFVAYYSEYSFFILKKHFHLKEINHIRSIPTIYSKETKSIKLDVEYLRNQIKKDIADGLIPFFYGGTIGSTCANIDDPVKEVSEICKKNNIFYCCDAAYSSSFFLVPEIRNRYNLDDINCICVNLSKSGLCAMGSAQFYVDDKKLFIEAITGEKADNLIDYPQYLKNQYSNTEGVVDFSNWQVGFGRKFNSLRIYWVIRRFGILGMQEYINTIIKTSDYVVEKVKSISYLDLFVKKTYALSCFRVMRYPDNKPFESLEKQNEFNLNLVEEINKNGFMFLSKAINNGMNFIRFNLGSYDTTKKDIDDSFEYFDKYYKLLYKKEVKPSHF